MVLLLLSSGLFLGWSLGANDAANVFGTAVATRMVKFRTAAVVCGVFVIVGAVVSGSGAVGTLGDLGAVNALGGSFMVALAAALAVWWMTKAGLPVSTSQAIIGGILGWNLFTGSRTDMPSLIKIVSTWVICPTLAAAFAAGFFLLVRRIVSRVRIHILDLDALTRTLLIVVGAFGAYSLGANNIANVMGVFVPAFPARAYQIVGPFYLTTAQVLFLVGGAAIAVGVFSYSRRVMMTVGREVFNLSPVAALVVVLAQALVLFLFASERLANWLIAHGLPPIPLVPVSSSQAVVGAVIGIALAKGGRNIRWTVLQKIAGGWVATPVLAALVAFLGLFILQNVFGLTVKRPIPFELTHAAVERLADEGVSHPWLADLEDQVFENARTFGDALEAHHPGRSEVDRIYEAARLEYFEIDPARIGELDLAMLTPGQVAAIRALSWRTFEHRWQLRDALADESSQWESLADTRANHLANRELNRKLRFVYDTFRVTSPAARSQA
jgi:PiT family inorganic phosphate transporter